jgi:hypothetical protein
MIWVILAALGVPLWLCAMGALVLILNNRRLRHRRGNIPVRVLPPGKTRWKRGHAIWVSNVFAWRSSPAGWSEEILDVGDVKMRAATQEEHDKLHHLADEPAVVTLTLASGTTLDVAAQPEYRTALSGPFDTLAENGSAVEAPARQRDRGARTSLRSAHQLGEKSSESVEAPARRRASHSDAT